LGARNTQFIVVGTKCDIRDNAEIVAEREALGKPMKSPEEYKELALQNGAAAYVECSAITRVNLETLFEDAIRIARTFNEVRKKKAVANASATSGTAKAGSNAAGSSGGCCVVS